MKWKQLDDGNFQAEGQNGIFLVFIIGTNSHAEYFPIGNQKSVSIARNCKRVLQAQRACENSPYWEKADVKSGKPTENRNKLHAEKTVVDGITFDSRKEAKRYSELKLLERMGEIQNLELQKEYLLIPPQKDESGKVVERSLKYIADFVYTKDGKTVVEDVKGYQNPATAAYGKYVIKRKLMLYKYGIKIQEV